MALRSGCLEMDRSMFQDYDERRRAQNREAQRKYRQRLKAIPISNHKMGKPSPPINDKGPQINQVGRTDTPDLSYPSPSVATSLPFALPPSTRSHSWAEEVECWNSGFSPNDMAFQTCIDNLYAKPQNVSNLSSTSATNAEVNSTLVPYDQDRSSWQPMDENFSQDGTSSTGCVSSTDSQIFNNMGYSMVPPSPQNSDWSPNSSFFERRSSTVPIPTSNNRTRKRPSPMNNESSVLPEEFHAYCTPRSECGSFSADDAHRPYLPYVSQYQEIENTTDDTNIHQRVVASAAKLNDKAANLRNANCALLQKQLSSFRTRALRTTDRLLELYDLGLCLDFYRHDEGLKNLLDLVHERFADLILTRDDYGNDEDCLNEGEIVPRSQKRRKSTSKSQQLWNIQAG